MIKGRRRALLLEDRPAGLDDVARALAQDICDVVVASAGSGLSGHVPSALDAVLLEMDLPPNRGLRLIDAMKQDPRWRWVFLVVVYPHRPCDEDLFAVMGRSPDMQACDMPGESRVAFLREHLPNFFARIPTRSERDAEATAPDALPP